MKKLNLKEKLKETRMLQQKQKGSPVFMSHPRTKLNLNISLKIHTNSLTHSKITILIICKALFYIILVTTSISSTRQEYKLIREEADSLE